MLDFNHKSQIFLDAFATIPVPDAIALHVARRAYWDNQTVEVLLQSPHNTPFDWGKCKLWWELHEARGVEGVGTVKGSTIVAPIGSARIPMPRVQVAQLVPLSLRLLHESGYELAQRSDNLLVLPSYVAQARYKGCISVVTSAGSEAPIVRQLNYAVETSLSNCTQVVVTNLPDAETLDWVQNGGKMLLISDTYEPAFWQFERGGSPDRHWITSTSWLRPNAYPNLSIDMFLNLPLKRVMPKGHITGLPFEDPTVQQDFLAGCTIGWVQRPRIHTVQFGYGDGKVVMTTYPLLESMHFGEPDPFGVVMLNDLIDYLGSDACTPTLRIKV